MIADNQRMLPGTSQYRVLHDHAMGADLDRTAVGAEHGTMQDAAARPDPDLAAEHGRRGNVGIRVHGRSLLPVSESHAPTVPERPWRGRKIRADRNDPGGRKDPGGPERPWPAGKTLAGRSSVDLAIGRSYRR